MLFQTKEVTVRVCFLEKPHWEWQTAVELIVTEENRCALKDALGGADPAVYKHASPSVASSQLQKHYPRACYKCGASGPSADLLVRFCI